MQKSWQNDDNCEQVKAYSNSYTVPQAALLWCGAPPEEIDELLKHAEPTSPTSEYGKHVLKIKDFPCFEIRCPAIQHAINEGQLKVGSDGGPTFFANGTTAVAYSRRTLRREDLKEWIAKEFPNDKPSFLFDEIERNTHPAITADTYQALIAERDKLKAELEKANDCYLKSKADRDRLNAEIEKANATGKNLTPTERQTMLKLIIGMAIHAYGYDPAAAKNTATGDKNGISAKLATHEISIDPDTIRKYLNEAKD